jgi:nucleoside-diphosphate-sugar epimerase
VSPLHGGLGRLCPRGSTTSPGLHGTCAGGREKTTAAICRKVIEARLNGSNTIEIWGDGEQTRSFTYVDDSIDGIMRIMKSDVTEPINLGFNQLVTINRLADIVEEIAGVRSKGGTTDSRHREYVVATATTRRSSNSSTGSRQRR